MKKLLFISLSAFAIFAFAACNNGGEAVNIDSSQLSVAGSGRISVLTNMSIDWGDIDITGGKVEYSFKMKNVGDDDLIIKSGSTTCMCTSAQVITSGGVNSPLFGMAAHGGTASWGYAAKPGEEFELKVVFDPMAHGPDAVGPITRSAFLVTSSKPNGDFTEKSPYTEDMSTEVKLRGNVLYKADFEAKVAPMGEEFKFDESEHDFGVLKQSSGAVSYDFNFEYLGNDPIVVSSVPTSCACTIAKISANEFNKGDKGTLTVEFDPNLHEEPNGKFFKTVTVMTDPALVKQPEVKIWAEIDLDLGADAYKLQDSHDDEVSVYKNISPEIFKGMLAKKDFFLLDVHIPEQEHIAGTDSFIAYNEIDKNLSELPVDKNMPIVVYCRSGSMSKEASQKLIDLGYTNVSNLEGGRDAFINLQ